MATKSTLTTQISNALSVIVSIFKVNTAFGKVVDEIYPATVFDTQATTNIFTRGSLQTQFSYAFKVKKRGNIVFIQGSITNTSATTAFALNSITEVTNTEYLPTDAQSIICNTSWGTSRLISFLRSPDYVVGNGISVPPNGIVTINGYYFTND